MVYIWNIHMTNISFSIIKTLIQIVNKLIILSISYRLSDNCSPNNYNVRFLLLITSMNASKSRGDKCAGRVGAELTFPESSLLHGKKN